MGKLVWAAFMVVVVGAIAGAIATDAFVKEKRQRVEIETNGRKSYKPHGQTEFDYVVGSGVGTVGGTFVGWMALLLMKGRIRILALIYGTGMAAAVGYMAGLTLPPGSANEPFAEGAAVGGSIGGCLALILLICATPRSRGKNACSEQTVADA